MMRTLLIISDWFAPAYKAGGPIRSCVNLARLISGDLKVFVLTGDRDLGDTQPLPGIKTNVWTEWESGIQVWYTSPDRRSARDQEKIIDQLKPDVLYLNSMYSPAFTIRPLLLHRRGRVSGKLVLAPRGMLQAGAMQYKSLKKAVFLRVLRLLRIDRRIHWHATDGQEAADILRYFPRAKPITIIPNVPETRQPDLILPEKSPGSLRMAFISRISPKKNIELLLQVLQKVPSNLHISLDIAGPVDSPSYWNRCLDLIRKLPFNVQTHYLGSLDRGAIADVLKKNHIFALPTRGENFGHAIFESLLFGRPVVISSKTPWQDIDEYKAGFVFDLRNPSGLQAAIEECAAWDQGLFNGYAEAAWQYAGRFLRESNLRPAYLELFH